MQTDFVWNDDLVSEFVNIRIHDGNPTAESGMLNHMNKFRMEQFKESKQVQPTLTTSDNIPILEGTEYWIVNKSTLQVIALIGSKNITVVPEDFISIGTEKALDEYIERNKKVFSMADIFEVIKTIDRGKNGTEIRNFLNDKFLELLKQK